ncbi:MAG: hypothetical protein ICV87_04500 [Gemmatimonadetes bacterium]|nr:hypothetical protein [Gemmatimonadota bacterium]
MRQNAFHRLAPLLLVLGAGCAHGRRPGSYLPVGASAWYGDRVADGVTLVVPLAREAAERASVRGLRAAGYDVPEAAGGATLRTSARALGGDTTLTLAVQLIPVQLPAPGASIVLTGRYSVGERVRNAPVLQRPGERNPLFDRLRAAGDSIRRAATDAH